MTSDELSTTRDEGRGRLFFFRDNSKNIAHVCILSKFCFSVPRMVFIKGVWPNKKPPGSHRTRRLLSLSVCAGYGVALIELSGTLITLPTVSVFALTICRMVGSALYFCAMEFQVSPN